MKKMIPLAIILAIFSAQTFAQESKQLQDAEAIKKMCGCFEVTFNFAETFNYSNDSLYKPSKNKVSKALEFAQLVTDEEDKVVIQHILQLGNPAEPMTIKHWRQDWLFENTDLYAYNGDNNWNFEKKDAASVIGQWTQKVYQVDDSPRYEGSSTWVHVDGKSYWENTTPAPLPRREYTTRADYNITMRGNRQEIVANGWVHDQDNSKIIRKEGEEDIVLAKEKGFNTYVKVEDSKCTAAADWWKENQEKWAIVRSEWDGIYGRNTHLSLEEKVENKALYKHLFNDEVQKDKEIAKIIASFVKDNASDKSKSK